MGARPRDAAGTPGEHRARCDSAWFIIETCRAVPHAISLGESSHSVRETSWNDANFRDVRLHLERMESYSPLRY
eukprot:5013776-Amphidinium_carterae.1